MERHFLESSHGTFKTGIECMIVRRDIFELIQPPPEITIKLNAASVLGFKEIKFNTIVIDGEKTVISEESFDNLKKICTKES